MQFNTGEPNLVQRARFYAGQNRNAASNLFDTDDVKNSINLAYEALWNEAKESEAGWGYATDHITSVADQVYYTLPADFEGHIESVQIDLNGVNLSTSAGDPTTLTPTTQDAGLAAYREGSLTSCQYYFFEWSQTDGKRIGIVAPPGTGGTNSIKLIFTEDITHLSADGDTPLIPTTHHALIALDAAIHLRAAHEMSVADLIFLRHGINGREGLYRRFTNSLSHTTNDSDFQASVAGQTHLNSFAIKTGFTRRLG